MIFPYPFPDISISVSPYYHIYLCFSSCRQLDFDYQLLKLISCFIREVATNDTFLTLMQVVEINLCLKEQNSNFNIQKPMKAFDSVKQNTILVVYHKTEISYWERDRFTIFTSTIKVLIVLIARQRFCQKLCETAAVYFILYLVLCI